MGKGVGVGGDRKPADDLSVHGVQWKGGSVDFFSLSGH